MTHPIREAAETKAELLANEICGCANREQHRRDVKLIINALLVARAEQAREDAKWLRSEGQPGYAMQLDCDADALEALVKEIKP